MPSPLLERVAETIRFHRMFDPDAKVLTAVSGGADSVCLLHVLRALGYRVEAAHLDHETRAGASTADAAFVAELCERWGVPLHGASRPVEAEADASPLSFEEYARQVRYEFLLRTARERGCTALATGHHAGDQAETVLMRVIRGTSPGGLAGIPPVRLSGGVRIVRPLIACMRDAIVTCLEEEGIPYRIDASNADPRYHRNRVRHDLLPLLTEQYNPRVAEALVRLAETQRAENELLDEAAAAFLDRCFEAGRIVREAFAQGPLACQRRAIAVIGWRHGVECPFDRVEAARAFILDGPTGQAFDLGGGVTLRNARDRCDVVTQAAPRDDREIPLAIPGETRAFGLCFRCRVLESPPVEPLRRYCNPRRQVFDADALAGGVSVRYRRPGDRFAPLGMGGTKKLQDYFVDAGVPRSDRDRVPLLVSGDRIGWVVGFAVDRAWAVTERTRRTLEVEIDDASE